MKKEFVIGEKAKLKSYMIYLFFVSVAFYFMYAMFMNMFVQTKFFILNPDALGGIKMTLLVGYVILVVVILTSMSLRQYIVITDQDLSYFSNDGFISQLVNTFCILCHRVRKPVLKISLKQIKKITLLYNTITSIYYAKGHSIVYYIELNDGTFITINPDSFYFKNDNIVEGISFMESKGVQIDDPNQLIDGLKDKNMKFADYVEKVVEKNEYHL